MPTDLKPLEALSQVVFVHDYIQLVFQDEVFAIYNIPELVHQGTSVRQGRPGFCDALVGLIGQRVISVSTTEPEMLLLDFERGARFRLLSGDEGVRGPEAFQFRGLNNLLVVEQNV
jgi:hypothetical protein